jgi:hypothetical protein
MDTLVKFFERLQSSDDATKRRAFIIGVTFVMVIVLVVWLRYFNGLLIAPPVVSSDCCASDDAGSFSPLETVKALTRTAWEALSRGVARAVSFVKTPAAYTITPEP